MKRRGCYTDSSEEIQNIARTADAPYIDGSVIMAESITIGDWRGYDLVAAR